MCISGVAKEMMQCGVLSFRGDFNTPFFLPSGISSYFLLGVKDHLHTQGSKAIANIRHRFL